jgi:LTXXQ motif family protein
MTRDFPRPFVRTLGAAAILGCIGLVGLLPAVAWAQGATSGPSDTAAPAPHTGTPPGAPVPESSARPPALDEMAQQIKYLHGRLRITPQQEPLWTGVAQVMRDNETALAPLLRERFQATQGGNAIEMLGAGEKLDAAQLDGLRKFIAAFQALYDSMSDAQKKIADYVFRRSQLSEESESFAPILPTYLPDSPPPDYGTGPAYPDYPEGYYLPDYSPLFVAPFIGIVVGPRFFFHGRDAFHHREFDHFDFHHPEFGHFDFHHPEFGHFDFHHPGFHAMAPMTHLGGGAGRIGGPSFRR